MPRPRAPEGFVTISPGIYISLTSMRAVLVEPNNPAPSVILIFGWMGALTRHLQNYSRDYAKLYPHATQIIVKCEPFFFMASERAQHDRMLPVVEALEGLGCLSPINDLTQQSTRVRPRVLVHSFSNGGGFQLISLARLLSSKYPSVSPSEHIVGALVFDSLPSIGSFRTISMALSLAIRRPVVRYIALILAYIVHALRLSLHVVLGVDVVGTQYLNALLDPRLLPWMNSKTPRLYVYSKKDELVPWQAVQQHADAAKASGLNVCCEMYEDSAHVAHMRLDPKRYWTSVQDLWQTACSEGQAKDMEAGFANVD